MTIQQQPGGGQLGVLIDYENVGLGSIQWLFDEISSLGRIIYRRAYTAVSYTHLTLPTKA